VITSCQASGGDFGVRAANCLFSSLLISGSLRAEAAAPRKARGPEGANRKRRGQGKPETFDFLGMTHICGQKWQTKRFLVRRKTFAKRLRAAIKGVRAALMRGRHLPVGAA